MVWCFAEGAVVPVDPISDFWTGAILGLAVGMMVGILWEEAFELWCMAIKGRRKMNAEQGGDSPKMNWLKRMRGKLTWLGVALLMIGAINIGVGLFSVITYTRIGSFIRCQAGVNQQSSAARKPRVDAADAESDALFTWLGTLPPLFADRNATPQEQQKAFRHFNHKLNQALRKHAKNQKAKADNPYPEDPTDTCGDY